MASVFNLQSTMTQLRNLDQAQLVSGISRALPPVLLFGAVIGIAWQLAQLTWLLYQPKLNTTPVPVVIPQPSRSAGQSLNTQRIADAHLFGVASAAPSDTDPSNLRETPVSLVLSGTIAFSDPQAGFAIVGENAANAKFYKVGASINGAIRLHSVYTDRVVIDRAGVLETLSLPHGTGSGMPTINHPTVSAGAQLGENIRRLATNNPSSLAQMIRVQPVFSNGTQKGYRVYPGRERAQFARLGLQPGDLITSINGTLLNDPSASNDILGLLNSSNSVMISIERNGNPMSLNLDISQISLPSETVPPNNYEPANPGSVPPAMRRVQPPNATSPSEE
jgi:general secretion pathway protein C